jgi:hypothetical protein
VLFSALTLLLGYFNFFSLLKVAEGSHSLYLVAKLADALSIGPGACQDVI